MFLKNSRAGPSTLDPPRSREVGRRVNTQRKTYPLARVTQARIQDVESEGGRQI